MKRSEMERMLEAWPYFGAPLRGPGSLVEASDAMWRQGFELLDLWLDSVQRVWDASCRFAEPPSTSRLQGKDPMRRASDLPWLPHMEAKVIPLRRSTDPAGSKATRVAMRVPLPWPIDGADSVSLEATLGAETATRLGLDRAEPPASSPAGGRAGAVGKRGGGRTH